MGFNTDGTLTNARPTMPTAGPRGLPATPAVFVNALPHKGKYAGAAPGVTLPMSLHHIIPWVFLWEFWNEMISRGWYGAARDFLSLYGVAKSETAGYFTDMKKNRFVDPDNWDQLICWKPWNLVRGPANRTDDPNQYNVANRASANFRKVLDFENYKTGPNSDRISAVIVVGTTMYEVIKNPPYPPKEKDLSSMVRSWHQLVQNYAIIEWDASMWLIDTDSPDYVAPVGGSVPVHPAWYVKKFKA